MSQRDTHVSVVQGVSEDEGITARSRHGDLVLRDGLGAIEILLLRDDSKLGGQNLRVRVVDPVWRTVSSQTGSYEEGMTKDVAQDSEGAVGRGVACPDDGVLRLCDCVKTFE